jgi:hypothetical protein
MVGRSGISSELRSHASRNRDGSERDRPDVAHRHVKRRKHQDRIAPERRVFIDKTSTIIMEISAWKSRQSKSRSCMRAHSHRWRRAFLAAQTLAAAELIEQIFASSDTRCTRSPHAPSVEIICGTTASILAA